MPRFRSLELMYVGLSLQVWSCLLALSFHMQVWTPRLNRAGYHSRWHFSWPLAVLLGQPSIWNDGAGRQPGGYRVQSWLALLDAAIGLLEQPCLQSISCCCSQILPKLDCSVSLGPLPTVHLEGAGTACPVSCLACYCNVPSVASRTE